MSKWAEIERLARELEGEVLPEFKGTAYHVAEAAKWAAKAAGVETNPKTYSINSERRALFTRLLALLERVETALDDSPIYLRGWDSGADCELAALKLVLEGLVK